MNFAESGKQRGPKPQTTRTARMIPGRRIGCNLQGCRRRAGGSERGNRIGFGIERIDGALRRCPMARRCSGTQGGGDSLLPFRRRVFINRADFEQAGIGKATIGIAFRRHNRLPRIDGRMTSRSALIGLSRRKFGIDRAELRGNRVPA